MRSNNDRTALVVDASRTLVLATAAELLHRGRRVKGTVRGGHRTGSNALAEVSEGRLEIEEVDITETSQMGRLRERLARRLLDPLFVNAGIAHANAPVTDVTTESFIDVMVTNALSPLRVIETLEPLIAPTGTTGIMSSQQGRITLNTNGGNAVYRASKSALNQFMRSYAARHAEDRRAILLINPG